MRWLSVGTPGMVSVRVPSRRLLAALTILALVLLTGATHVSVEVVVSHSVISHLIYTSRCAMVN